MQKSETLDIQTKIRIIKRNVDKHLKLLGVIKNREIIVKDKIKKLLLKIEKYENLIKK